MMILMTSVKKTATFVKKKFADEHSGHDWWHMYRVWMLAKHIAQHENKPNMEVVELAALLHDIADFKFHDGNHEAGAKAARKWLKSIKIEEKVIQHVEDILRNVSFKSRDIAPSLSTLEGQIVHDADKLDAIGAIGIARVFSFGGAHGRLIYDPDLVPLESYTYEAAKIKNTSAIHHFDEKLLHLKDRMYTKTGKKLAARRHLFMEKFLEEFHNEWEGKV